MIEPKRIRDVDMNISNIRNIKHRTFEPFCDDEIYLSNRIGTCWTNAIKMILYFDDKTKHDIQYKLNYIESEQILNDSINIINKIMPPYILDYAGNIKNEYIQLIINLLNIMKKRFKIKNYDHTNKFSSSSQLQLNRQRLNRQTSLQCENEFTEYFNKIFDIHTTDIISGGNTLHQFFLLNLISSLFLNKYIYYANVNYDKNKFKFSNLDNLEKYIDSEELIGNNTNSIE